MIQTGFLDRTTFVMGNERRYVVFVPHTWDGQSALPAILFLHGRGESGTDGLRQIAVGLGPAIQFQRDRWPYLVVFPQKCDGESSWEDEAPMFDIILEEVAEEFPIDESRRYITGLSQGGRGTLRLARGLEWEFAAAAPICGWATPEEVEGLLGMPLWAFHGMRDTVIVPERAIPAIQWLMDQGSPAKLTLFEEADHNSWDAAYGTKDLHLWFLQHRT